MLEFTMSHSPRRIQIVGSSNAGKSTLAAKLAAETGYPHIELDALNWEPNWHGLHQHNPEEFRRRIQQATTGDSWIIAGNYTTFSQELLWGTNYESFWPQLRFWHSNSLLNWLWLNHGRQRNALLKAESDLRWQHLHFIHLKSPREATQFSIKTKNP